MTPEISEFSYGFALTNEIVGWAPLNTAPVFPSLIEEGRTGGGYDVKLDRPGIPLYLQFKRADCLTRRSAWEIRDYNTPLSLPFYRFKITESGKSNQHQLLLALDEEPDTEVYYAAPRFHTLAEINAAWSQNQVASRSIFVEPNEIGPLDHKSHHVAYDNGQAFLCSEPRPIKYLTSHGLVDKLQSRLNAEREPLGDKIQDFINGLDRAMRRAKERFDKQRIEYAHKIRLIEAEHEEAIPIIEPVQTHRAKPLSEGKQKLRQLADNASKNFNTQLIIAQKNT